MLTFSPGKYFVGDLCYHDTIGKDGIWNEICDFLYSHEDGGSTTLKNGIKIAIFHTAWGDGGYSSNVGTEHGVDSGTIGIVRVPDSFEVGQKDGYAIIEFQTHFTCHKEGRGTLNFGHVVIETDPPADEEYIDEDDIEDVEEEDYDLN